MLSPRLSSLSCIIGISPSGVVMVAPAPGVIMGSSVVTLSRDLWSLIYDRLRFQVDTCAYQLYDVDPSTDRVSIDLRICLSITCITNAETRYTLRRCYNSAVMSVYSCDCSGEWKLSKSLTAVNAISNILWDCHCQSWCHHWQIHGFSKGSYGAGP